MIVGHHGVNYWIEIKTRNGKLRAGQVTFRDAWKGQTGVARTPQQALKIVGYSDQEIFNIMYDFDQAQEAKRLEAQAKAERKQARAMKKAIKK